LAAHEGYPGHHVFNALIEKHLVNGKGWMEYAVYNLFSPLSLLAEGSANYGIEVALLMKYALSTEQRSHQRLRFIEQNRAYVITYNYGQDLVKEFLASKIDNSNPAELWRGFSDLLSRPRTGSMMQAA
jgi:hypothetical protein